MKRLTILGLAALILMLACAAPAKAQLRVGVADVNPDATDVVNQIKAKLGGIPRYKVVDSNPYDLTMSIECIRVESGSKTVGIVCNSYVTYYPDMDMLSTDLFGRADVLVVCYPHNDCAKGILDGFINYTRNDQLVKAKAILQADIHDWETAAERSRR